MIKEREEICEKCRMLPSIHHLEYPCCYQPCFPLNEYEYELIGAKPKDKPTIEIFRKMMEISTQLYCREKMLLAHPIEWWYEGMIGGK
jgi:hypothetical protein